MSKSGLFAHFRSKEQLQLQTLEHARQKFIDIVVRPTLTVSRGQKRVQELFDRWLVWESEALPGGCIFVTGAVEYDDRPSAMRDALVTNQHDWLDTVATIAETAVRQGDFRVDVDPRQFAFEVNGLTLGYHHATRLLNDDQALLRVRVAFEALLDRARER